MKKIEKGDEINLYIAGKTDTGKKRSMNEDSFHAEKINNIHLAVVCDGVGGAKAGEVASSIGVNTFVETFKQFLDINKADDIDYKDIMVSSVAKANGDIFSASKENKENSGMGTTMVACAFDENTGEYYAVNVGDSRFYMIDWERQILTQITKDHSLVQDLVDSGALTKEQAEKSPNKNIITRVLGMDDTVDVDFYNENYKDNYKFGVFLLCSDGLSDYVDETDIIKFVSNNASYEENEKNEKNEKNKENEVNEENKKIAEDNAETNKNNYDIENCLNSLISKANENGGGDNITAIIIKP